MTDPQQTTIERYRDAALALLPPGRALSKEADSGVGELAGAIAVEYARIHEHAERFLANLNPPTARELLPEWEETLALIPSAIASEEERAASVVAKLRGRTSHARIQFENIAEEMGYLQRVWRPVTRTPVRSPYAHGPAPDTVRRGRWRVTMRSDSSSSFTAGTYKDLIRIDNVGGGDSSLTIFGSGTSTATIQLRHAGSVIARQQVTYAAGQTVVVEVDLVNRVMSISGATTGNIVALPFDPGLVAFSPAGDLYVAHGGGFSVFDGTVHLEAYDANLDFVQFPNFAAGVATAGSALYSDEWANVVRIYVPVDNQTADDELRAAFEYLRRAHAYYDIILEGPMGAERVNTPLYDGVSIAADQTVSVIQSVPIRYSGFVSIQATIHNATGVANAPTDTPVGVWELYVSSDGNKFERFSNTAVDAELAKIAPNGNNLVNAFAIFDGMPGTSIKLRYNATSGGATARATVSVVTW